MVQIYLAFMVTESSTRQEVWNSASHRPDVADLINLTTVIGRLRCLTSVARREFAVHAKAVLVTQSSDEGAALAVDSGAAANLAGLRVPSWFSGSR